MAEHEVKKTLGLSYQDVTLGSSVEVKTSDKEVAEEFLNKSLIRDAGRKIAEQLFGRRTEENTLSTIVVAARKIQLVSANGVVAREIPMKISIPLLENAGLEDKEFLRERWANMLANASTGISEVKISYPDILRELDEIDIKFLELLYSFYELETSLDKIKNWGYKKPYFIEKLEISEEVYEETTDNLLRLQLIKIGDGDVEDAKDGSYTALHHKKGLILFTYLGLNFVKACKF